MGSAGYQTGAHVVYKLSVHLVSHQHQPGSCVVGLRQRPRERRETEPRRQTLTLALGIVREP